MGYIERSKLARLATGRFELFQKYKKRVTARSIFSLLITSFLVLMYITCHRWQKYKPILTKQSSYFLQNGQRNLPKLSNYQIKAFNRNINTSA
jgi:hypothetical protein